jgi:hypothetical protein
MADIRQPRIGSRRSTKRRAKWASAASGQQRPLEIRDRAVPGRERHLQRAHETRWYCWPRSDFLVLGDYLTADVKVRLNVSAAWRNDERLCYKERLAAGPRLLAAVKTDCKFRCPAKIVQADPRCGAVLLDDQLSRLTTTNPHADIVQYRNCGHSIHRMRAFEQRFLGDAQAFVSKIISGSASKGR